MEQVFMLSYNGFVAGAAVGYIVGSSSRRRYYYGNRGYRNRDFGTVSCASRLSDGGGDRRKMYILQDICAGEVKKSQISNYREQETNGTTISTNTTISTKVKVYWE